jgi:hypothetical protein
MNNGQQNAAPEARPEAQVWLNIGYESAPFTNPATGETETRFVSIPVGVPLDTQKPIDKRNMTDLNAAQNDLLADLQKAAASLESGEERDVVLTLRMRRVRDSETPVIGDDSPFARKVDLFAVPASNEKGK